MKTYYFISGLPRSGSTLLSVILKQNPDFYADIASPVSDVFQRIIDSFNMSGNQNIDEQKRKDGISRVEARCINVMDPTKSGNVYMPLRHLQLGLLANPDMIHLVEYDDLCKDPEQEMKKIYNFIQRDYYNHDFNNVYYKNEVFDLPLGMRDLHTVQGRVQWKTRNTILPESVWNKYSGLEFWWNNS